MTQKNKLNEYLSHRPNSICWSRSCDVIKRSAVIKNWMCKMIFKTKWEKCSCLTLLRAKVCWTILDSAVSLALLQILQRGSGGAFSVWHSQTPDLWECGALAEGAEGPCRQQHCHHAGRQQERPTAPQGRAHRRGPGLCRYKNQFMIHDQPFLIMSYFRGLVERYYSFLTSQRRTICHSSKHQPWIQQMLKKPSRTSSQVCSWTEVGHHRIVDVVLD